jgi:hypothetical protein
MMWTSIRRIRLLAVAVVVVVLATSVQARASDGGVRLPWPEQSRRQPDGQNGRVAGMALDGTGRPLADHRVELRVRTLSGRLRATQTVATAMTDARGQFAFTGLAPGIFEVAVLRGDTILRTSAPIQLSAGAMDHTVTLSESTGVSFSFEDLRAHVKPGATVKVTDTSGTETTGTVADVSPSSLALLVNGVRRELPETQVRQITRRRGSRLGRGALIGAAVGAGVGFGIVGVAGGCSSSGDAECQGIMFATILVTTAAGTAAGAGIGLSIKKSETIFLAPVLPESARLTVSPIASKTRQGLALSISF